MTSPRVKFHIKGYPQRITKRKGGKEDFSIILCFSPRNCVFSRKNSVLTLYFVFPNFWWSQSSKCLFLLEKCLTALKTWFSSGSAIFELRIFFEKRPSNKNVVLWQKLKKMKRGRRKILWTIRGFNFLQLRGIQKILSARQYWEVPHSGG